MLHTVQIGMGWFPEQAGGLNRVYYNLSRTLPQIGVKVQGLVTGSPDVAQQTNGQITSFAPSTAPLPVRWWKARREAGRIMAEQKTSLVAAHFALYAAPLGRRLRDVPLVVHFHGPWAHEGIVEGDSRLTTHYKMHLEQRVYRHADRCIVLSEAFRDILHGSYGVPLERIRIVPGGVDLERFAIDLTRDEARERLGWPQDRPVVLTVRRLQHRMGLENLITAMHQVREAQSEALLLIAGKGPRATALNAQINTLQLDKHVRLLGFLSDADLPLAYRAADLTVVPTTNLEGFGLITVESLAAGTPVLVTPVGGLPEVVRGLSPSLVLESSDAASLAQGLVGALQGTLPLPDASSCRSYAQAHYAWPLIARRVREVYEEALD